MKGDKRMNKMRVESWCGYDIRFVEIDGEWWAILKDICDALNLKTFKVSQRLDPKYMEKADIPLKYTTYRKNGVRHSQKMIVVNEKGIYQALFASKRLEARKFQMWTFEILEKLRKSVGLQQYEVMRMTEPEIQDEIDWILDTLYWDEEKKCVMQSITVQGGDVEQVPFK